MKIPGGSPNHFLLPCVAMPDIVDSHTPLLRGPVALSHVMATTFIKPGDHVVDATCGNGNDTLLLADLVGAHGTVWGFDIQSAAIDSTRARLAQAGLLDRVTLIEGTHEQMCGIIHDKITAVFFNLGYLPGGDRSVTTTTGSTLAALASALDLLTPGGIMAITLYPGHPEGRREYDAAVVWAAGLDPRHIHVWGMGQMNVAPEAPRFILVQKGLSR